MVLFIVPLLLYSILLIPSVQTSVVNYLTGELSKDLNTEISIGKVYFRPFKSLVLDDVIVFDQKQDTLIAIDELTANVDSIFFKRKQIYLEKIKIDNPQIFISHQDSVNNYDFLLNAFKPRTDIKSGANWSVSLDEMDLIDGHLRYNEKKENRLVEIHNLNISVEGIKQDSLLHCELTELAFNNSFGLNVKNTKGSLNVSRNKLVLTSFLIETYKSSLGIDSLNIELHAEGKGLKRVKNFYVDVISSKLAPEDVITATPLHSFTKVPLELKGRIYGSVDNIKGRDVICNFGPNSQIRTSFDVNGLPNLDETFLYIDVRQLRTIPRDMEQVLSLVKGEALKLPTAFKNLEQIKYSGNFTGFLTDLVAYGEFRTSLGSIQTDIGLKMDVNNHLIFSGNLSTESFNIGKLANAEHRLGDVSMNVAINGKRISASNYNAFLNGTIDTVRFNSYDYKNIQLNGLFTNDIFDGDFLIDDPNGQLGFNGKIDLSGDVPNYNFSAHLTEIRLDKLNLTEQYTNSFLTADIETNFSGNDLNDIVGFINIKDVTFDFSEHHVQMDSLLLISVREDDQKRIVLQSDIAEGDLVGVYNFTHAGSMVKKDLIHFLPSLSSVIKVKERELKRNDFTFSCTLKKVSKIASLIVPELDMSDNGLILGSYNSANQSMDLEVDVEHFNYKGIRAIHPELHLKASDDGKMVLVTRLRDLEVNNLGSFQNLSLHHTAYNDTLQFNVFWNNWDEYTNSGSILTTTSFNTGPNGIYAATELKPSYVMVRDSLWEIQSTRMHYHPDGFSLKYFRVHHGNQEIGINGFAHRNIKDGLQVHFQNISLSDVVGFQNMKQVQVSGFLNGTLDVQQLYQSPIISGDLSINRFNFNNDELGDFSLKADYKPKQNVVQIHSNITKDGSTPMNGGGVINLANNTLNLQYDINNLEIGFINLYLSKVMQNLSGTASGRLSVAGPLTKPELLGSININKAFFDVGLLQTTYSITDSVIFKPNLMEFKSLQLSDRNGNKGVFKGSIQHRAFRNMRYNLSLIADDMLVLDTKYFDNQRYYGEVYADGNLSVTGTTNDLIIDIAGTTMQNTDFYIPLTDDESAEESNFIRFVQPDNALRVSLDNETKTNDYEVDLAGMTVSMDLDITPAARCQVIFDSTVGDILKGRGNGNLQIKMDKEGGINFYGDFNFEGGDYMFTLQNVLNKKFVINQGSMIRWDGSPYDADIDLNATYKLKTSLLDLMGTDDAETVENYGRRIPVNCNLLLTDRLTKPSVQFEIKTPSTQDNNQNIIDTYINTEEETNRQVLSLLVLNRFFSQENGSESSVNNKSSGNNAALVTTTEMLSNQLSHWLSQISSDIDIGVSYRPASEMTDDEVEVALSTQMFNNRVTVNGNVGYGEDQTRASNLIGDFDVEVKLNNSGSLRAKAYTRTNNDLVYSTYTTSPTTQGVGISFKEEFDTLEELMQRYWMKITGKKKPKETNGEEKKNDE